MPDSPVLLAPPPLSAADRLAHLLSSAGIDAPAIESLLGAPEVRLTPLEQEALWVWRARSADPRSALLRLFFLQDPLSRPEARRAFGAALASTVAARLVRWRGSALVPCVQISLHQGLFQVSDAGPRDGEPPGAFVLGPTTATLVLDRATVPVAPRRALDLGTGTGYLALRLAARAAEVVAADLSARALAYARFNARLNGVASVRSCRSNGLTGVSGRFGLIVGNLPFVLAPERRFVFRDAGANGEGLLAGIVRATGRHLVFGGFAQYLGQWAHGEGLDEERRIAEWQVAAGCDAVVLRLDHEPVDVYAARWSCGPGVVSRAERRRRLHRWLSFYARQGINAISTGLITLRRRATKRHFIAIEDATAGGSPTGAALLQRFADIDAAGDRQP